jgi:hypothetical protein
MAIDWTTAMRVATSRVPTGCQGWITHWIPSPSQYAPDGKRVSILRVAEQRPNTFYTTLVVTRNTESGGWLFDLFLIFTEGGGLWGKDKLRHCEADLNANLSDGLVRYFDFLGTVSLPF